MLWALQILTKSELAVVQGQRGDPIETFKMLNGLSQVFQENDKTVTGGQTK